MLDITTEIAGSEANVDRRKAQKISLKQYVLEKLRIWINSPQPDLLCSHKEFGESRISEMAGMGPSMPSWEAGARLEIWERIP